MNLLALGQPTPVADPEGGAQGRAPFFGRARDGESKNPGRHSAHDCAPSGRPFLLATFLWASKEKPPAASVAEAVDLDLAHPEQINAFPHSRPEVFQITIKGFRLRRVPFVLAKGTKTACS